MNKMTKAVRIMRLPQDRILHIDTELAGDEVRVVLEWQGELVRCKDCRYYCSTNDDGGLCVLRNQVAVGVYDDNFCNYGERKEL